MIPWEAVGEATTPDGTVLSLVRRGAEWEVRADGFTLMSSRAHGSEDALADLAFQKARPTRVLVGGLGLGYTLRAALDRLPPHGSVTVAEISPELLEWNRTHLAHLAGRPLDDPRARVVLGDVWARLSEARAAYDAVLLDVDNGPESLILPSNGRLYSESGILACRGALRPGGVLAVWATARDDAYVRRLQDAGFEAGSRQVRVREGQGGRRHVVFLAVKAQATEGRPGGARSRALRR